MRRRRQRRGGRDERVGAARVPNGERGERCDGGQHEGELEAARVHDEQRGEPEREGDQAAPAEREVEGRRQRHERRGGDVAADETAAGGEAERQQQRQRRQDPERVPVAEGRGQAVHRDRVERPEALREEPRQEPVERERVDCQGDRAEQRADRRPAHQEEGARQRERVDQVTLNLGDGVARRVGPDARQRDPGNVGGQRADGGEVEAADARGREEQREHGEPGDGEARPAPGDREVAAGICADEEDEQAHAGGREPGAPVDAAQGPRIPDRCRSHGRPPHEHILAWKRRSVNHGRESAAARPAIRVQPPPGRRVAGNGPAPIVRWGMADALALRPPAPEGFAQLC